MAPPKHKLLNGGVLTFELGLCTLAPVLNDLKYSQGTVAHTLKCDGNFKFALYIGAHLASKFII